MYVSKAKDDLKSSFVQAMNKICNGMCQNKSQSFKKDNLDLIRNVGESALFNILFLRSLESKSVLPMDSTPYKSKSLTVLFDKLSDFDKEKDVELNSLALT